MKGVVEGDMPDARARIIPSFRWLLAGLTLLAINFALSGLWASRSVSMEGESWIDVLLGVFLGLAPALILAPLFCFVMGANYAWKEKKEHGARARVSRWLNVVAFACYLGVFAFVALSDL